MAYQPDNVEIILTEHPNAVPWVFALTPCRREEPNTELYEPPIGVAPERILWESKKSI